jgi:hypothetical protein
MANKSTVGNINLSGSRGSGASKKLNMGGLLPGRGSPMHRGVNFGAHLVKPSPQPNG